MVQIMLVTQLIAGSCSTGSGDDCVDDACNIGDNCRVEMCSDLVQSFQSRPLSSILVSVSTFHKNVFVNV